MVIFQKSFVFDVENLTVDPAKQPATKNITFSGIDDSSTDKDVITCEAFTLTGTVITLHLRIFCSPIYQNRQSHLIQHSVVFM